MPFQDCAPSLRSRLSALARRPAVLGTLLAAALVAGGAGVALVGALSTPSLEVVRQADPPAEAGAPSPDPEGPDAPAPPDPTLILVHVGGAVAAPGVYAVPEGARVEDALAAAGGLGPDAAPDAVNRARVLADGEQVVIPTAEEAAAPAPAPVGNDARSGAPSTPAPSGGGKVNLNTASAAELTALNGIGEATAAKIVADREARGPFSTVDDLARVSGIGPKKLESLRDAVCV
ncbi:MAG: ComEA family DNA-binding protein [Eggerthellaceae bacterium]|nr:ComEA family DNA-binding protein [Eggerthellaceae bacterium]